MSSQDMNGDKLEGTRVDAPVDAESEDEAQSRETIDELLAIGNDPDEAADFDKETSATLRMEESLQSFRSERGEKCSCNSRVRARFTTVEDLQMRCMLCGKVINGNRSNFSQLNKSVETPPGMERPLFNVVTQSFAEHLPLLPSTSLEDNSSEQDGGSCSSHQSASLVTGRSKEEKIPVQNVCELSVQSPSPGMMVRMFLIERTHQERHEMWYILYMIPENKYELYKSIYESYTGEVTSQQGYRTRQIPFAVDNARSKEFQTVYVQEQISVSFEIQNRWQENVVTNDAGRENVFRVPNIHCESENRVAPGAKSHFRVQYIGGPGKLCQEQGKITLKIDSTVTSTLFFSIAIWVPD